jgi:hypothetical protein
MTRGGWEKAATGVEFPVAVLADSGRSPRLTQWGGPEVTPDSVTLSYEVEDVLVTTYRGLMWGEFSPWGDLEGFVEDTFGFMQGGKELERPRPEELEARSGAPSSDDQVTSVTYRPLPDEIALERKKKRRQAVRNAERKTIDLPFDGSTNRAIVVGESGIWAAGCQILLERTPQCVLLSGGAVSVQSLRLELVHDLPKYLHCK